MDKQFIILILIIILFLIILTYKKQENITSDSGKTLSDEALQSIASVYNTQNMIVTNLNATNQAIFKDTKISGNLNVSGTITGNVTGNVTGNANINTLSSNISGSPINVNSYFLYNQSIRPYTLTVAIGLYKGPIYDASQNTFSTDKYTVKQISGNNTIGVRNNKWWICPYPNWHGWQQSVLEIIPIPLNQYYSNYSNAPPITVDTDILGWATPPINSSNNSYYVYDSSANAVPYTQPVTTSS